MKTTHIRNAIILSAGMGSRFVPITCEVPKGLIRVKGEILIERQIRQLHQAGIRDVYVVVGYMKDRFEYLKEKFNVKIIHNPDFEIKNNLTSLYYARHFLSNSIVTVSDIWMNNNHFLHPENESWYSCSFMPGATEEWCIGTEQGYITRIDKGGQDSWALLGPAYFNDRFSRKIRPLLEQYHHACHLKDLYWEDILIHHLPELPIRSFKQPENTVFEFESLEQLRNFDRGYCTHSGNAIMEQISRHFNVPESKICSIMPIKTGMTNLTFSFRIHDRYYIFRKPRETKCSIINREHEYQTLLALQKANPLRAHIEEICFFDRVTGAKISKMLPGVRISDHKLQSDIDAGLDLLGKLHQSHIQVNHRFNVFDKIRFYESLLASKSSQSGYLQLRNDILSLENIIPPVKTTLCHIDFIHTNILISGSKAYLVDWEYAAMSDPLIDIAMYALFAAFSEEQTGLLLARYLQRQPSNPELLRTYIYVAAGGLLWGLWADYMGICYSGYGKIQYGYARKYNSLIVRKHFTDAVSF